MSRLIQDVRHAVRQLRRSAGFSATVVVTLALGIGLNAAIFSVVDSVLLRPLGYRDAERIFGLETRFVSEGRTIPRLGGGDYVDVAEQAKSFESIAYYGAGADGVQLADHAVYTDVAAVSAQFGSVMGVTPAAGRLFTAGGADSEAMVSAGFARNNFGSATNAVGKPVRYGEKAMTVVGVMPEGFGFPGKTQVWLAVKAAPDVLNRTAYNQRAVVKLRSGVSAVAMQAELQTISGRLASAYPEDKDKAIEAMPLQEQIVGKVRPMLQLLMGAVALVMLIVCANVGHLLLVRSTRQQHAIAVRAALGARRGHLAWRAVLEALLLAAAGALGGVLIAVPTLKMMLRLAPLELPRVAEIHLNADVLVLSFALALLAMLTATLLPVWRSWRLDPAGALKAEGSRGIDGASGAQARTAFVVLEIALTFMLSTAAVLLVRQMVKLSTTEMGFATESLMMVDAHAPAVNKMAGNATGVTRLRTVLERLRALPGVESASAISGAPTGRGGSNGAYAIYGQTEFTAGAKLPNADFLPVESAYFGTMKIPLLRGRMFTAADGAESGDVVIISKALAEQSFAVRDPIGQQIECGYDKPAWMTVVGVVGDVRQDSPASAMSPALYMPIAQHPRAAADVQLMLRTRVAPVLLMEAVQKTVNSSDPSIAMTTTSMEESLGASLLTERFRMTLFSGFAGLSILLAGIGIYGVTAYTVAQRSHEFALRMALGADRMQVLGMVLRSGLVLAGMGLLAGAVLSLGATRIVGSVLTGLDGVDSVAYVLAAALVLLIAMMATLLPARRAASIEPMRILRNE